MDYNEEQITELTEELDAARREIERLETAIADREVKALHLESQLSSAADELAAAQQGIAARDDEIGSLRARGDALEGAVRDSAGRYRALVLEHEAGLPADLIGGDSIDEIDQAVERARETVASVRGHLESQAQSSRVPAGAPPRTDDLARLSAQEKIARGIGEQRAS